MHCSPLVYLVSRQHTASWAGVHSNYTVNGIVYILKIKHIFKIRQPHFIVVRVWMLLRMAQLLNSEVFIALQTDDAQLYCPGHFLGVNVSALQCPPVSRGLRWDIQ